MREVNRQNTERWPYMQSGVDADHLYRKYKMGAEASTFRGWRKLAAAYILDLLKVMAVMALMRLVMVLSILAGWVLVVLFIWFILFY